MGFSIPGVSTKTLLKARIRHLFGYCQIVVGFTKTAQNSYTPLATCWICGLESPEDLPTAASIRKYEERLEQLEKSGSLKYEEL
jgi:hypothetical protein